MGIKNLKSEIIILLNCARDSGEGHGGLVLGIKKKNLGKNDIVGLIEVLVKSDTSLKSGVGVVDDFVGGVDDLGVQPIQVVDHGGEIHRCVGG